MAICDMCQRELTAEDSEAIGERVRSGRVSIGDYCRECIKTFHTRPPYDNIPVLSREEVQRIQGILPSLRVRYPAEMIDDMEALCRTAIDALTMQLSFHIHD